MPTRIRYIDSAKFICIVLMILGHSRNLSQVPYLANLVYSFHMPLFFIVSGFFMKPLGLWKSTKKYSKAYIKPYVATCFIALMTSMLIGLLLGFDIFELFKTWLVRASFCNNGINEGAICGNIPIFGPTWFLLGLFWGILTFSFLRIFCSGISMAIAVVACWFFSQYTFPYIHLPMCLQTGVASTLFIYIGDKIREHNILQQFFGCNVLIIIVSLLLWMQSLNSGLMDIGNSRYPLGLYTVFISVVASLLLLATIHKCGDLSFLSKWGKYTLPILCGHCIIKYNFMLFGNIFASPFTSSVMVNLFIEWMLNVAGAFLIAVMLVKIPLLSSVFVPKKG